MKTPPTAQTFGCFDVELRGQWLEAKGDPLSRLDAVIDWESFRPLLVQALARPAKGPGGRPANDPVKMFKLLVVIAILAILTAFLLPALSSGKGQAQAASCMANVRQLQLAWQMYAHDNQDRLVLNAWTNSPDGSWVYFQSANTAQLSAARLGCSTRGRSELTVRPKHDSQSPTG